MTIPIRERWILANWYHVDILSLFVIGKLPNSSTFYVHIPKTSEDHVTTFKVIPSVLFKFNQREMCPKKPRSLEYILIICIVTTPCRRSTNTRQQPVHIQSAWPPWANWHGDLGEEIKRSKKAKNGWHIMDKKGRWNRTWPRGKASTSQRLPWHTRWYTQMRCPPQFSFAQMKSTSAPWNLYQLGKGRVDHLVLWAQRKHLCSTSCSFRLQMRGPEAQISNCPTVVKVLPHDGRDRALPRNARSVCSCC